MNYLILQHPGHNRVYYNAADKMALAELQLACNQVSVECTNIEIKVIEDIRYLSFSTEKKINDEDLELISRLSFVFALFTSEEINGKTVLNPIRKTKYEYLDGKIGSLLKYQGKTNELFTRMMLNVALLSSNYNYSDKINLLDPVAGKGTTLFEGAVNGFNAYGIEIEPKHVQETALFFKKYLETERLKHLATSRQVYGSGKANAVFSNEITYALSKEEFKDKDSAKTLGIVNGDTKDASNYFKKEYFHLIVGDLPYGIVHGNKASKKEKSNTRNPWGLISECLPSWHKTLKKGGVIVVAWNSFLISRHKLARLFTEHGFEVLNDAIYNEFEHMVDKSIKRDIVVAKKN